MNVLILGTGAVGSVIAKFLSEEKSVKKIVCGDNNLERAKQFLTFKSEKVVLKKADASDSKNVASLAKDMDLIINTTLPRFNEPILDAALSVGANYQDLCSYLDDSNRPTQLKFDSKFKKEGLVGLFNTGMSPGVTNVLAKNASEDFDSIESIRIRTLQNQVTSQPIFALSPEIIMEESSEPALVYRNKKFEFIKPFSEVEEFSFPRPTGKRFVFSVYGDEVATLPMHISVQNVDFKATGNDIESAKALYDLGLLEKTPVKLGDHEFIPIELISRGEFDIPTPKQMLQLVSDGIFKESEVIMAVELVGEKFSKPISLKSFVRFPSTKQINKVFPGATYISFPTGLSAYCFSTLFSKIKEKGVYPPEALAKELRHNYILELATNGITFNDQLCGK